MKKRLWTHEKFTRAYRERDRAALEWKAQGGQVVGCLGSDVPEEFLIAAGFLTVRVCGDPRASAEAADRYIERAFDPFVRSQFARIVEGEYSYLDHLIVSRSSDALVRVFYYLRELRGKKARLRSKVRDLSALVSEDEAEAASGTAEEAAALEETPSEEAPTPS